MMQVLRRAMPILLAGLALANTGCGKSPDHMPAGPSDARAARALGSGDDGQVTATAVGPPLGAAADAFAVLAGSTVTNAVSVGTTVTGDVGVAPGTAITGFPPGIIIGNPPHSNDGPANAAQGDITTAFNALAGQACDVDLTSVNLGGLTLTPGVYCFSTSAQLTGALTLNGLGNAGSVWVFKIGSTLTTASGSSVNFINSGQACGAFWQVGSSATLGSTTAFAGNILAQASITLITGASNNGGLFARDAAVTLDQNIVNRVGSCGAVIQPPPPTPIPPPAPVPTLPEVAKWGLLAMLLASGVFVLGRR